MKNGDEEKLTPKEIREIFTKALKVSISVRSKASVFINFLGFPLAFLPIIITLSIKRFADEVQNLYGQGWGNMKPALSAFFILSLAYLLQLFFNVLQNYYAGKDSLDIEEYIRETLIRCACRVKYKYIDNDEDFLNKISFAKTDSGYRVADSIGNILVWLQNLITFFSMLFVLLSVDIWIVAALLITTIPAVIIANIQKDEDYRRKTKWMKEGTLVIHQFHDCCAQYTLNDVRFFGLFDFLKAKWRHSADVYIKIKNKMTCKHVVYNLVADFLRNCVFLIILFIVAKRIFANPEIGIGTFLLVLNSAGDFQKITTKIFVGIAQFTSDIKYMKDFFELKDMDSEFSENEQLEQTVTGSEIVFKNVTFAYPDSPEPALCDINICIHPGEKVAIVGENGSGKTTFVNLLLGLYSPDKGNITIGGMNVLEHLHSCRKNIAAIFQNFSKYETTIRKNIIISDTDKPVCDDEIMELMKQTGAYSFVEEQPDGLDEMVGSLSDKGNNLSGGQWQRIAITRALYRERAKIMVLDEPTAALDPVSEAELYRNFADIAKDKTTLFVSHRLGISKVVDRILVFKEGRIVEDGSHSKLMDMNGEYSKMYKTQAQWYS